MKAIQRPPNEPFQTALAAIIPDWAACVAIAKVLGITPEGVHNSVARPPRGDRGMMEAAFKRLANAAGYDVVVMFVPKEKSK